MNRKKEIRYLYSAHFCSTRKALRHGSHSFTCMQLHQCLPFPRTRSPPMTPPQTEVMDI